MAAVGIHAGRSSCSVAHFKEDSSAIIECEGRRTIPSVIKQLEARVVCGHEALSDPTEVAGNVISDFMSFFGKTFSMVEGELPANFAIRKSIIEDKPDIVVVQENKECHFRPEDCLTYLLTYLRDSAGITLEIKPAKAVITVPDDCNLMYQKQIVEAGTSAGFNNVHVLREHQAGALAYSLHNKYSEAATFLFIYFSANEFKLSLCEFDRGTYEIVASHRNTDAGGNAIIKVLKTHFIKQLIATHGTPIRFDDVFKSQFKLTCEQLMHQLSFAESATEEIECNNGYRRIKMSMKRSEFEGLIDRQIQRIVADMRKFLQINELSITDIDDVVCMKGCASIPKFKQCVESLFGTAKVHCSLPGNEVCTIGAARYAQQNEQLSNAITPKSNVRSTISVGLVNGCVANILKRNSPIPTRGLAQFICRTDKNGQFVIEMYVGERVRKCDNYCFGRCTFSTNPRLERKSIEVIMRIVIDADNNLTLSPLVKVQGAGQVIVKPTQRVCPPHIIYTTFVNGEQGVRAATVNESADRKEMERGLAFLNFYHQCRQIEMVVSKLQSCEQVLRLQKNIDDLFKNLKTEEYEETINLKRLLCPLFIFERDYPELKEITTKILG